MTDTTAPEAPATDAVEEQPAPPATDTADAPLGEAGEKALAEFKRRAREAEKARKELEARVREFEDRDKSEQQRLEERAATAERERDDARVELTRLRMATRYGIAEDDLDLLGSGSDDEIEDRARRLADRFASTPPASVPGRPAEQLRPLRSGATAEDAPADGNDWFRRFVGAD